MPKIIIVFVIGVILLLAVGYRGCQVIPYPMGGGNSKASPDGKLEAHVFDMHDKTFWGNERDWYEFSIRLPHSFRSSDSLRIVTMDPLPGKPIFHMRTDEQIIFWADDSKSVTFKFQGIELKMNVE